MTPRVVLDSNVVLSALLFPGGRLTWIRHAWAGGRFTPLVSEATTRELVRALSYSKFRLDAEEIEALLAEYLPFAEAVRVVHPLGEIADPPDPDDRIFLELAVAGAAGLLVTGDRALQPAAAPEGVKLISPEAFRSMIGRGG